MKKSMTHTTLAVALAFAASLNVAGLAFANDLAGAKPDGAVRDGKECPHTPCGQRGAHRKEWKQKQEDLYQKLSLSPEQRSKLDHMHEQLKKENQALMDESRKLFEELRNLPNTPENKARREAAHQRLHEIHMTLHEKKEAMMQGILSPEQFKQFTELKKQQFAEWKAEHPMRDRHQPVDQDTTPDAEGPAH